MAYRDQEAALRERKALLERERARWAEEAAELETALREIGERVGALDRRLQEAGPLSGAGGWRADRVDVAAWVLALLSVPLLYAHVVWNEYIERDPTVIPAILWLATPGLLAVLVAWPYRKVSGRCRAALVFGLLGVLAPLVNLALGPVGW
ncbi:MAG TPA: hypothetical protein RMH85_01350 [Polyangiaceae bacterium LLY-WYZ-15_(1-7)]|nr:hypothetical protein [Sandaracinus sp.]MBJ74145.1 hypothetical protein [Sandaracinus sp.]HJL02635.1 hypothetical protein [Polyangiaceae bacterium LLY-WYZ-15_(1-7)]HJL07108.1 hypothetical protein [Polyangiaceae bacterium LLY-WYZ-15_(1-7)]HJL48849.1 hypothetical protein [Polyangiaceae bacterium LLY-WYZ-15_(1-7)]